MLRRLATGASRLHVGGSVQEALSSASVVRCLLGKTLGDSTSAQAVGMHAQAQPADDEEEVREISNPRIHTLADEILQLNLLEIHDLTSILKKKLGVTDSPMMGMPMGMPMMGQAAAPAQAAAEPEAKKEEEKTEFDVKLESFEATSKIKLIKEVRGLTDLGLKEAKELVEKAPVIVKVKLDKKSAEEVKEKLEKVGAKVNLE
ncbi:hypothetical protein BSKO_03403 [Bryopsis sp. KO-2023]|nr:hypothetical protein BSKO_03403 [Bryopsis sp. KO-2023]